MIYLITTNNPDAFSQPYGVHTTPHHSTFHNHTTYTLHIQTTGSGTQALVANMNAFLLALSTLSGDVSARVRKAVCQAIILLATVQLSILEPMFGSICTFMLKGVLDEDEGTIMSSPFSSFIT